MQSTESSVLSIIAAFTSGLDVFKRLRERRRQRQGHGKAGSKKSHCKHGRLPNAQSQEKNGEELRLSKSLRRGSADVQKIYEEHARKGGARYAHGDAIAHSSLTQTLLKLNAGLVNIISSFLSCGRTDLPIDYRSLTSLSDSSRAEAIDALGQLYKRLSRSDLALHPRYAEGMQSRTRQSSKSSKAKHGSKQELRVTETAADLPPGIARVTVHTSQTHLAQVRPANRRKGSSTSASSSKSSRSASSSPSQRSTAPATPLTPPPPYPPSPGVAGSFPFPLQQSSNHQHSPSYSLPSYHMQQAHSASANPQVPQHAYEYVSRARRQDKTTPSYYSIATDSTKLGEIPMRKWTVPFDYAEMERLNAEALATGWRPQAGAAQEQQGRGNWFGRLFRRGGGADGGS